MEAFLNIVNQNVKGVSVQLLKKNVVILDYLKVRRINNMNTVRCNMCDWEGEEEDLILGEDEDGYFKGCPNCNTDYYLMDIDKEVK